MGRVRCSWPMKMIQFFSPHFKEVLAMAYTFDYDYIEAVTAFLNGDELNDDEKDALIALADTIQEEAKKGFPLYDFDDEDEEEDA